MTLIPFNYNEQQLRAVEIRAWLVNHNNQTARRPA